MAEVLITLTIIGVIAVLTIPNLMKKWEDQHTVSAVKEAYAIMDHAFKLAIRENGPMDEWNFSTSATREQKFQHIGETLKHYLKIQKFCSVNDKSCVPYSKKFTSMLVHPYHCYETLKANSRNTVCEDNFYKGWTVLSNGMIIAYRFWVQSENNFNGGDMFVDINGKKGPNRYGYDAFNFHFNRDGLFLKGSQMDCKNINSNGFYCGVWIMNKGNVDYKYRDISAEW